MPVFFDLGAGDCLARDIVEEMGDGEEGEGGAFVTAALSGDGGGEKQRWSRARRQRLCPWR